MQRVAAYIITDQAVDSGKIEQPDFEGQEARIVKPMDEGAIASNPMSRLYQPMTPRQDSYV